MAYEGGALREATEYSFAHFRTVVGVLVTLGTLVPALFFVFNTLDLVGLERVVATLLLVLAFAVVLGAFVVYYLLQRTAGPATVELTCLAFEILNSDDGKAHDDDHVYEEQVREYDISGETARFSNRFKGRVRRGHTSDGVVFKYVGDYGVDADDISVSVHRDRPSDEPGGESVAPEILDDENPYALLIKLPFGETLTGDEKFDVTIEADDFGEAPNDQPVARVHFPMHRYKRIDEFDATIRTGRAFDLDAAAKVEVSKDLSQHRNVRVEDLDLVDVDVAEDDRRSHSEYRIDETDGNELYVFRFAK